MNASDQLIVRLNGSELTNANWEYKNVSYKKTEIAAVFLSCELSKDILIQGENTVSVELVSQPSTSIETGEFEVCTEPF